MTLADFLLHLLRQAAYEITTKGETHNRMCIAIEYKWAYLKHFYPSECEKMGHR